MAPDNSVLDDYSKKYGVERLKDIKLSASSLSELEILFKEVLCNLLPKQSDYEQRKKLIDVIGKLVRNSFGSNNEKPIVEPFGSFIMDMFTADSDLDLSVKFSGNNATSPRNIQLYFLRNFANVLCELQKKGVVQKIQSILSARVPIVKFVDSITRIECDVSVENHDGVLKSLIIYLVSSIDERFRNLSILLKVWAKAHDINSSKDHTLNSLSVTLLVVIHLQTCDPPILPPFSAVLEGGMDPSNLKKNVQRFKDFGQANKETLAELFVSFFDKLLPLRKFWKHGLCASVFEGSWITNDTSYVADRIDVEDFIHRSENCARAVSRKNFQVIYNCIQTTRKQLFTFSKGGIEVSKLKSSFFGSVDVPGIVCTLGPQKGKHLELKKKNTKKIKVIKKKKVRVLGLAATGTKVMSQPGSSNWDAPNDQHGGTEIGLATAGTKVMSQPGSSNWDAPNDQHDGTENNWDRYFEGTAALKRKQEECAETVASTSMNTIGLHSVTPSKIGLKMDKEDPQKPRKSGKSSGAVLNRPDMRKKARHSSAQTGVAQHQQVLLLPHQQYGFNWQNQRPPSLPHQIYDGLRSGPQHVSDPHQTYGMQRIHPISLVPLQDIGLQQAHLPVHLIDTRQSTIYQQHPTIIMQQPLPNLQGIDRPLHVAHQFGDPTYRLPHNWPVASPVHPLYPAGHDAGNLFRVHNPWYANPNHVPSRPR